MEMPDTAVQDIQGKIEHLRKLSQARQVANDELDAMIATIPDLLRRVNLVDDADRIQSLVDQCKRTSQEWREYNEANPTIATSVAIGLGIMRSLQEHSMQEFMVQTDDGVRH